MVYDIQITKEVKEYIEKVVNASEKKRNNKLENLKSEI